MIAKLAVAWCLMAVCVLIHAGGVAAALRRVRRETARAHTFLPITWLFVKVAGWMILLHLVEIVAWALVLDWGGAVEGLPKAVYFSAVTYTTTGYGDVILPEQWRLVGAIEALTGILMCGWSTGFFFAFVSRIHADGSTSRS